MAKLRAIGDIHNCITQRFRYNDISSYVELCQELDKDDYSVQLGDMGFIYDDITANLDPQKHVFFAGNHDNMNEYYDCPNALGDWGLTKLGGFEFFYIRGAFSLDMKIRQRYDKTNNTKCWWKNEQLSQREGLEVLAEYEKVKPDVVFSHDCPSTVAFLMGGTDFLVAFGWDRDMVSSTQHLLQQMLEIHSPKLWIYAHWHREFTTRYRNTDFYCLPERHYLDFAEGWNIIGGSCYAQ